MDKITLKYEKEKEERLDIYLVSVLDNYSRSEIQKLIKKGCVLLNNKIASPSLKLRLGDIIEIETKKDLIELVPENIPLDIVYEDEYLAIINKKKNMLTHPTPNNLEGTLVNALLYRYSNHLSNVNDDIFRQGIVHRLDKNTAGLMVIAKDNEAHKKLADDIKNKRLIRKYRAVVMGVMEEDEGTIDVPIKKNIKDKVKVGIAKKDDPKGKRAITNYRVLERFEGATYLELELKTGRTHQIRCHMAYLNHPVVGDSMYGAKGFKHKILDKIKTNEQVLQSFYIKFNHPITGQIMEFELDEKKWDCDIIKVLNALRKGI